jgi:hypothetical protein
MEYSLRMSQRCHKQPWKPSNCDFIESICPSILIKCKVISFTRERDTSEHNKTTPICKKVIFRSKIFDINLGRDTVNKMWGQETNTPY